MQKLSEALSDLQNTTLPSDKKCVSPNSPQHGSGLVASKTNIQPRTEPLPENQLTQIASKLLLKTPFLTSSKKKNYTDEGDLIGEEDAIDVQILLRDGLSRELIESALRMSPARATIHHLERLAMHKRLGSSERDRSVLLHDYALALRPYSDFVVFATCKAFWENDKSPFYPKIADLAAVCETMRNLFSGMHERVLGLAPPAPIKRVRAEESEAGRSLRDQLITFLRGHGETTDYSNIRIYSNYQLEGLARKHGWRSSDDAR